MNLEEKEEKKLVEKAKSDPEAFSILYEKYYSQIFAYILKRTANIEDTKDITSITFLKALKKLWTFKWKRNSFSSWLYKIASNEIVNFYRKRKKFISLEKIPEIATLNTPLEEIIKAQKELEKCKDFLELHKEILKLPLKYQEVIVLRFFEKKKIKEICEILGKKEGTVKSLLHRAIKKLRNFYKQKNVL